MLIANVMDGRMDGRANKYRLELYENIAEHVVTIIVIMHTNQVLEGKTRHHV